MTDHYSIAFNDEYPWVVSALIKFHITISESLLSFSHPQWSKMFRSSFTKQVHKDRRQGVRVQPQFPPHPTHQARQPSLPAGAAGPVYIDKFHSDQRRSGGPAAGCRGQHGETWPGTAKGEEVRLSVEAKRNTSWFRYLTTKRTFWQISLICCRNVKVNPSIKAVSVTAIRCYHRTKLLFHIGLFEFLS